MRIVVRSAHTHEQGKLSVTVSRMRMRHEGLLYSSYAPQNVVAVPVSAVDAFPCGALAMGAGETDQHDQQGGNPRPAQHLETRTTYRFHC